ncbi:hypothetical protein MKW94_025341 [Papaver nudicaule]|uniref:Uncharacterized protein n=1 Tax=Papaver nudicaule TaxID=74823 RepID=A0AA41RWX2_PAPNU|nr:hypothetical protein [Papaver nudicaule]
MPSTSLFCYVPTSSTIFRRPSNSNEYYIYSPRTTRKFKFNSLKFEDIKGLTGQPIYSSRFGMESEYRSVFVDEVKFVGCLKCALFVEKHSLLNQLLLIGRIPKIKSKKLYSHARLTAFVCSYQSILMVEKSDQDSLELLMSKQLRALLRMSTGNSVGACVSNIFVDKKFQSRFYEGKHKASDTIFKTLLLIAGKTTQPYTNKLRDAVEVR